VDEERVAHVAGGVGGCCQGKDACQELGRERRRSMVPGAGDGVARHAMIQAWSRARLRPRRLARRARLPGEPRHRRAAGHAPGAVVRRRHRGEDAPGPVRRPPPWAPRFRPACLHQAAWSHNGLAAVRGRSDSCWIPQTLVSCHQQLQETMARRCWLRRCWHSAPVDVPRIGRRAAESASRGRRPARNAGQ